MNESLLTKEEIAVRLNISAYDVDKLRKTKNMPFVKIGRNIRYDLEKVRNFIRTLSTTQDKEIKRELQETKKDKGK